MMLAQRDSRALVLPFPQLSLGPVELERASTLLLALGFALSVGFAGMTAARIARIERDYQPALQNTRRLGAPLEATRLLLRDSRLGVAESRIDRADSLAQRFHTVATSGRLDSKQRSDALAYDATFGDYYVAARRAAASMSMSLDADGSSAEDANLGYGMLRENLAAGIQSQQRAIDAARPTTAPIELAAWLAAALLTAAALFRRIMRPELNGHSAMAAARDYYNPIAVGESTSTIHLHEAVERLARKRLSAAVAAARVAKRNNDRQIEVARSWEAPMLSIVATEQPRGEMDVYVDEPAEAEPAYGRLTLVSV